MITTTLITTITIITITTTIMMMMMMMMMMIIIIIMYAIELFATYGAGKEVDFEPLLWILLKVESKADSNKHSRKIYIPKSK